MTRAAFVVLVGLAPALLLPRAETYPTLEEALRAVDVAACPYGAPYALASELSPGVYGAPYSVACPSEAENEGREP